MAGWQFTKFLIPFHTYPYSNQIKKNKRNTISKLPITLYTVSMFIKCPKFYELFKIPLLPICKVFQISKTVENIISKKLKTKTFLV